MTLASFRHYHPSWKITLYLSDQTNKQLPAWTTKEKQDFQATKYRNAKPQENHISLLPLLDLNVVEWDLENRNPVYACDLLQWKLLHEKGCVYSDMDILWIDSLERVYKQIENSDVGICLQGGILPIGFLYGSKGNAFYEKVEGRAHALFRPGKYQIAGKHSLRAAMLGASIKRARLARAWFKRNYPELQVDFIPPGWVYPWDWRGVRKIFGNRNVQKAPEKTIGIHWFGGSPYSQGINRQINIENISHFRNTWCKYAVGVLKEMAVASIHPDAVARTEQLRKFLSRSSILEPLLKGELQPIVKNEQGAATGEVAGKSCHKA